MGGELDRYDSPSTSGQARSAALRRRGGHDSRDRGFVLLFVLWILTGIALLLALYSRTSTSAPAAIEAQLANPVAERQLDAALDYVLWHLTEGTVSADARWIAQSHILRTGRLERVSTAGRRVVPVHTISHLLILWLLVGLLGGLQDSRFLNCSWP